MKTLMISLSLLIVAELGCGTRVNRGNSGTQIQEQSDTRQKAAFLAGALLGDNVTWVIAERPVSSDKRRLFAKCALALDLPGASDLLGQVSTPARGASTLATIGEVAMRAIMQFEDLVRPVHGQEIADLVRIGSLIMMISGISRSLEFATSTASPSIDSITGIFATAAAGLKRMGSTLKLPMETSFLLRSLPDYRGYATEAAEIMWILNKISDDYGVAPLTEMTLRGGKVSFADVNLARVATECP